jgi:hypothetical protein
MLRIAGPAALAVRRRPAGFCGDGRRDPAQADRTRGVARQQLTSLPPGLTVLDVDISVVGIEIVLGVEEHSDIVLIDRAVRNRPLTVHR